MSRQRNNGDPYETKCRYECRCPETGKLIHKGDTAVYFPKARKMYHQDSKAAEQYRSMRFAEANGMMDASW